MRKRNLKINIFLSPDENKIFEDKAKKSGLSKSEFFRNVILDYQLKEWIYVKFLDTFFYEFL